MRLLLTISAFVSAVHPATAFAFDKGCSGDLGPALISFVDAEFEGSTYSVATLLPAVPIEATITLDGKYAGRPVTAQSKLWSLGWTGPVPEPALVERWFNARAISAASLFPDAEVAPPGTRPQGKPMISATCPVVSDDDRSALLLVSWLGDPLAYREELVLFERDATGQWTVISKRLNRVS